MYKKFFISIILFIFLISIIFTIYTPSKVYAEEENQDEYELYLGCTWIGALYYVIPVDSIACLNANGDLSYGFYYLEFVKHNANGSTTLIEENINIDNLTITSSNKKILTTGIENGHVFVKGIAEGKADVTLKYIYQGKEYINKTTWTIRPDPTPSFELNCSVAVLLDNSILELNKNEQKDVSVFFSTLTTMLPIYPDGYDESNYFICNWKSLNESIVKIEKGENSNKATLKALAPGKAQVECVVKTADNMQGSITKTVNITVLGQEEDDDNDNKIEYELNSIEPITVGSNRAVIEIGDTVLTQVGLINKSDGSTKEIDTSKLKVKISNPDLVSNSADNNIIAKSEGIITVTYTYSFNDKTYTYEEKKYIVGKGFSNGDIPVISNSVINLKSEEDSAEIYSKITRSGTYGVEYPEGYDQNNYYKNEWSIENNKIAKIEKVSENKIKIIPLSNGITKLNYTIKTADGKENITKIINITVSGITTDEDNIQDDPQRTNEISEEPTTEDSLSPKPIPQAGILPVIEFTIIIISLIGIICFIKYKK